MAFCIPHTRLIRAGSFADSNLALCDPQIGGGEEEACALECVCLGGPTEIYIFLLGVTTVGCDPQNVITDAGGAAVKQTAISSGERRCFLIMFYAFVSQTSFPQCRSSSVNLRPRPGWALCSGWGRKTRRCRVRRTGSPRRPGTRPARQSTSQFMFLFGPLSLHAGATLLCCNSYGMGGALAFPYVCKLPGVFLCKLNSRQSCNQCTTSLTLCVKLFSFGFLNRVFKHKKECN